MRAVVIRSAGGPEVLEVREVENPMPAGGEVLVRVRAAGVNRADLLQRAGRYPAPPGVPADIPGLELAGEVQAVGADASQWRVGDRVMGIVAGGAQAELAVVDAGSLVRVPDEMDWITAGAVAESFVTAHDALVTRAGLRRGDRVLVTAAGSGVGLAVIQLARALGARPFGTTRTAEKLDRAREHGLEDGFVVGEDVEALGAALAAWTAGAGVNVTIDLVAGPYLPVAVSAAARLGRIVLVGTLAGASATLPLGTILRNRLTLVGTVLRSRSREEKAEAMRRFAADVVPLLVRGEVKPVVEAALPLERVAEAHELIASGRTFGRVVLTA